MKPLKHILFILCCVALPLCAQDNNKKYLAGAVPQVDGKVVFTKTFSIPGMPKAEIYDRMLKWMDKHLAQSGNNSLVAYSDEELGMIVGNGDEWLIFTSNALALDRCRILYKLTAACNEETCTLTIDRLRYIYREGAERYSGEEMISDKYALNKDQTKLVPGYAKWRKKTVDFVNDLCIEAADILSSADPLQTLTAKEQEEEAETALVNSGTTVITPLAAKQTETVQAPVEETKAIAAQGEQAAAKTDTPTPAAPVAADTHYIEVSPDELASDALRTAGGTTVIAIGEAPNEVTVTPGAGASLGKVNGKAVVFTILSPDQPYEAVENAESYTVRFYPNGEVEPSLVLTCVKQPSPAVIEGMPRTYIGRITSALVYQP
ncbi:MAG: DUF4468 domain-containing protein [Prevotellaceae bacterium]|nr:DUF4468 domain-containing protein [Prevotellaceae bacterium]